MRTDRRGFPGALAASIAAVAAQPALRSRDEDVYENRVLGVRLLKPAGWKYVGRLEWSLVWPVSCDVEHFLVLRKHLYVGINFGRASVGHSALALQELESLKQSIAFLD